MRGFAQAVALLVVLLLCTCGEPRRARSRPVEATASRVTLFLRSSGSTAGDVTMIVGDVQLVGRDGETYALELVQPAFSARATRQRTEVAGAVVPPGQYVSVIFWIRNAALEADGRRTPLTLTPLDETESAPPPLDAQGPKAFVVPLPLEVTRHDAVSVFLEWNVAASMLPGSGFRPAFAAALERRRTRLRLLYVSDSATGSVLAVSRQTGDVVATIKVGDQPRGLALTRDRRLLCVANAGDGSLSVVDLLQGFTESTIPIRFGGQSADVVTFLPGPTAAVVNSGMDTVSFFDLRTRQRTEDIRVERVPTRLAVAPAAQRLFVLNSRSDDMSVIDLPTRTVIATIPVQPGPADLAVGRRGRLLAVGHTHSPKLLIFEIRTLELLQTIQVGAAVTAVGADRRRDRFFVGRSSPSELAVVDTGVGAVTRRIPLSAPVQALLQPLDGPNLYGASPEAGGLIVVDIVVGREKPLLSVGSRPYDVALAE